MRSLFVVLLVACTSTRQLAAIDPRLRVPEHEGGFVVNTTGRWHERIDPNTAVRFHGTNGAWSDRLNGRDLYVDREGAWIDRELTLWQVADAVRIEGITPEAGAQIVATRPDGARLERDGDVWILFARGTVLRQWLIELELAIARLDPVEILAGCSAPCLGAPRDPLRGDDAKLYALRVVHSGAPLGTWSVSANDDAWLPPMRGPSLVDFLSYGRTTKVGWRWDQIAAVEVENISGAKTLGGIVGTAAVAIVLLPVALVMRGGSITHGRGAGKGSGGTSAITHLGGSHHLDPSEPWAPELAPPTSLAARPLFSTGRNVRSIVLPTVALDASAGIRGDLIASGAIARLRFMDLFEIGGGVRVTEARGMAGTSRSTTGVFQVGLHLPLDAGFRFAIPLGLEIGAGGEVARDVRVPWGLRYTQGRWFATALPASPSYLRIAHETRGRWSLASGVELGTSF